MALSVCLGGVAQEKRSEAKSKSPYELGQNVEILVNMMRTINLFYVDEVSPDRIMNAAAEGMTKILDPYTTYISPESMEAFEVMTTGKYGGVGSIIRQRGDYVEFSGPYEGSPADRAGIRPGDIILKIGGTDAKGMTTSQVSNLLKGDPGSSVRLTVGKFPTNTPEELKITRERIAIPGIPYHAMLNDSVGYISHAEFTEGCSTDLLNAFKELQESGMKRLILDYRGNTGGLMQEAVKVLSLFLPEGSEVVSTRSSKNHNENQSYTTESAPVAPNIPIAVLVDGNSASAAEIVAGALQDYDRAVLVGERTFGKGLVQSTFPLGSNSQAKITTAKYHLPSGRCIQAIEYGSHKGDGSVEMVPDSLITEFKTKAGRKVYDGGGVMPDVVIEPEYISTFSVVVYAQGLIDDFITEFCRRHYDELEGAVRPIEYSFTDENYAEFVEFMKDKEVAWENPANYFWKEFTKAAEKESWHEGIKEQMAEIAETLKMDTEDYVVLYKDDIKDIIESQIVTRYCFNRGEVMHSLEEDNTVKEAVKLLGEAERYSHILTEQDTLRKSPTKE